MIGRLVAFAAVAVSCTAAIPFGNYGAFDIPGLGNLVSGGSCPGLPQNALNIPSSIMELPSLSGALSSNVFSQGVQSSVPTPAVRSPVAPVPGPQPQVMQVPRMQVQAIQLPNVPAQQIQLPSFQVPGAPSSVIQMPSFETRLPGVDSRFPGVQARVPALPTRVPALESAFSQIPSSIFQSSGVVPAPFVPTC